VGYRPGDAAYRRVVVALFAAGVTTFALLYSPQAVLPELAADFGMPASATTLSISVTTLAMAVALLVVGPVTERVGRTPIIRASVVVTSLVGIAHSLAPNWPTLLVLRGLQGISLAGMAAVAMAYLREEVAPEAHARATGLYVGGTAIGGMLGRLVVGGVADLAGWRWALAAMGGDRAGVRHRRVADAAAVAGVRARRVVAGAQTRAMVRRLLTDRALLALYGVAAVAMGSFIAVFNTVGFRLRDAPYYLSVAAASLVYLSYAPGSLTSAYAGRIADRVGRRPVLPIAFGAFLVGLLMTGATPLWLLMTGMVVFSGAFFAVHSLASGWVVARAQAGGGGIGQASAFYLVAYYAGSSIFGGLAGPVWAGGGWTAVLAFTGALVLIGVGLAWWLTRIPALADPPIEDPGVAAY
jgi:YNFM family putative membrane transporter